MDELLMLHGEARLCRDCGVETIFLPVDESDGADAWVCTACDGAVSRPVAA